MSSQSYGNSQTGVLAQKNKTPKRKACSPLKGCLQLHCTDAQSAAQAEPFKFTVNGKKTALLMDSSSI